MTPTRKWYGYTGRHIRVDLTTGQIDIRENDPDVMTAYVGARGIGIKTLFDEIDPAVDALSPDNAFVFATGPLTGFPPAGNRCYVVTKSPLTGGIANSSVGGYFGVELKFAGYDFLVVTGRASRPVYLWIDNDHVELRSAEHLWGLGTEETDTGAAGDAVFTLRTMADAKAIGAAARSATDVLMIGAGLVGLETGYALAGQGKRLTILAKSGHLLSRNTDEPCARLIQERIEGQGVRFLFGREVTGLDRANGRVRVATDRGDNLRVDLIVVGKGVVPNLGIVEGTPIAADRGIRVGPAMQTSVPGVFAAGDVAETRHLLSGRPEKGPFLPLLRPGAVLASGLNHFLTASCY